MGIALSAKRELPGMEDSAFLFVVKINSGADRLAFVTPKPFESNQPVLCVSQTQLLTKLKSNASATMVSSGTAGSHLALHTHAQSTLNLYQPRLVLIVYARWDISNHKIPANLFQIALPTLSLTS